MVLLVVFWEPFLRVLCFFCFVFAGFLVVFYWVFCRFFFFFFWWFLVFYFGGVFLQVFQDFCELSKDDGFLRLTLVPSKEHALEMTDWKKTGTEQILFMCLKIPSAVL